MVSVVGHDKESASAERSNESVALIILIALVLGAAALSLLFGAGPSAGHTFLPVLAKTDPKIAGVILWEIRVPRTALALMVGFTLGLTGAALQGFLRNPLAEPALIGASSGAALGAVAVFYFGLFGSGVIALPFGGVAGALAALAILFGLVGGAPSVTTLILAGVAVNAAAGALTSLLLNLAPNPFAYYEISFWMMGSVADRGLDHVALAAPFMIAGLGAVLWTARGLDALTLGEDVAASLGVHLKRMRLAVIGGTGLAVGAGVAVTGVIGFVGLVVPYLVRPFVGHVPSKSLVPSGLAGAALLTFADLLVRLLPGQQLQLGVVTALIGGPFFLMLILKRRSEIT